VSIIDAGFQEIYNFKCHVQHRRLESVIRECSLHVRLVMRTLKKLHCGVSYTV
jgi:hypothetical protein